MSGLQTGLLVIALGGWALVLYAYAGYPLVLSLWAAWHQLKSDIRHVIHKSERRQAAPEQWPAVAVVIAAYNEEQHIAARINNLLQQDYPTDKIRIYIGSDGSKDRTADIVRGFSDERIKPLIFETNRGKASVLNDLRAQVTEPVVIFSDANTYFHSQAVKRLTKWFAHPDIGGVSGELRLLGNDGQNQDSLYWRMEQALKYFEGRIGGLLGANGAIYAMRKELWPALAPHEICDDFVIGMTASAKGFRLVYDPSAWAEEETPQDISEEHHRRLRIGVGNFQALFGHPEFLTRTNAATRFTYISHKILRWVTPHLLLASLLASLALACLAENDAAFKWQIWSALQVCGYAATAWWYQLSLAGRNLPSPARLPTFFFALNWAFLLASIRYARGSQQGAWRRTSR